MDKIVNVPKVVLDAPLPQHVTSINKQLMTTEVVYFLHDATIDVPKTPDLPNNSISVASVVAIIAPVAIVAEHPMATNSRINVVRAYSPMILNSMHVLIVLAHPMVPKK